MVKQLVKSPKKLLVYFVVFAIVVVSASVSYREYIYQDRMALANRDVLVDGAYVDVFNWDISLRDKESLYDQKKQFEVSPDGSGITMFSNSSFVANPELKKPKWEAYENYYEPSWITVTGDFEIQVKLQLGTSWEGLNEGGTSLLQDDFGHVIPTGSLKEFAPVATLELFGAIPTVPYWETEFIRFSINQDGYMHLLQNGKAIDYAKYNAYTLDNFIKLPQSGEVVFRFENVAKNEKEVFSIINPASNTTLYQSKLLMKLFSDGKKVSWGMQVRPTVESFSMQNFKVISLGEEQHIFRGEAF